MSVPSLLATPEIFPLFVFTMVELCAVVLAPRCKHIIKIVAVTAIRDVFAKSAFKLNISSSD
jgi:hypothetical protein